MSPLEPTENVHLIKEMPAAMALQEESASPSDHHIEQQQT